MEVPADILQQPENNHIHDPDLLDGGIHRSSPGSILPVVFPAYILLHAQPLRRAGVLEAMPLEMSVKEKG